MSDEDTTFGGRLYSELRKLSGYNLVTGIMDYNAIQQLKAADREGTLKLFRGSSYEVIQLLKSKEPEEVAQHFVAKAEEAKSVGTELNSMMLILISSI
ncbi:MAG: hypothetical protein AAGG48_21120 [Planctomycetota bacterium]